MLDGVEGGGDAHPGEDQPAAGGVAPLSAGAEGSGAGDAVDQGGHGEGTGQGCPGKSAYLRRHSPLADEKAL